VFPGLRATEMLAICGICVGRACCCWCCCWCCCC
jgi:hypothetical protein